MAGILDPKQRIIDFILTPKGREQLANNDLDLSFVSFTDKGVFYDEGNVVGVVGNIDNVLTFEAYSSDAMDNIVPETNDLGNLRYTLNTTGSFGANGRLYTKATGSEGIYFLNTGSLAVYNAVGDILSQSVDRFHQLKPLSSVDSITNREDFFLDVNSISFETYDQYGTIESLNPFLLDHRLANLPQYEYLPPVVKTAERMIPIASYPKFALNPSRNFDDFYSNITSEKQVKTVSFKTKKLGNNVLGQMFVSNGNIQKLVAIDLGSLVDNNGSPVARAFHMGNLYTDGFGVIKFVRHFTLIFR